MTPKEKAKELFYKFMMPIDGLHKYPMCHDTAKQCALIAVEEVLNELPEGSIDYSIMHRIEYWKEVKKEIEAL